MHLKTLALACALALVATPTVHAQLMVDDLLDGAFDPFFNYDFDLTTPGIQSMADTGNDFTGVNDFAELIAGPPLPAGLGLASDAVEITFNTLPGQFVDYFETSGEDFAGPNSTTVTYNGIDLANQPLSVPFGYGPGPYFSSSTGLGFSRIDSVVISGLETFVFRVAANVVPEPSSLALLVCGPLALLVRRRRV